MGDSPAEAARCPHPPDRDASIEGQRISDRNAQTIDILPTIADVLRVTLPWHVDGVSLVSARQSEPSEKVVIYDSGRRRTAFDARGPDSSRALARKRATFDTPDNAFRIPQPDRYAALVGRPLSDLDVEGGGGSVEVDYLSRPEKFDAADDETPFDVGGRSEPARAGRGVTYVALAVNGVVQAITRTWDANSSGWLATPPLTAWREGGNDLQVFVVEGDERAPVLRRCELRASGS